MTKQKDSKDTQPTSLKTKAQMIVRLHCITFGTFNGKRCIYADTSVPEKDMEDVREAMRDGIL